MSKKLLTLNDAKSVSLADPTTAGQVPTYNGADIVWAEVAAGTGGGGGGLTYLLNYSQASASAPSGTWEKLTLTPTTSAYVTNTVTAPNGGTYVDLADFVTNVGEPGATTVPPGFWDLNVYLTSNGSANETSVRVVIGKWDGTTYTDLHTSAATPIDDPSSISLYTVSQFVPSTVLAANERITIKVQVTRSTSNAHTVTGYFEGVYYSHMHTSLGAPGGTGLVKVDNGIVQAPASLLVASDISSSTGGLNGAGKMFIGQVSGGPVASALSGDVTMSASGVTTLASTTVTPAAYGSASSVATFTVDAKGRLTAAATTPIAISASQVTSGLSGVYAPLASPTFTGTPAAPTPLTADDSTAIATTSFVKAQNYLTGAVTSITGTANQVIASGSTGAVTLSLPQSIGTTSSPSFGNVTVTGTGSITVAGTGYLYLTNQTAGLPLVVQAGKNVIAQAINLAGAAVTGTLPADNGGTGQFSYAVGDLLYAATTTTLSRLADAATGNALISGGVNTAPLWGKIGLTTHVSGTLPVANGGTGATTLTGYVKGNGTSALTASLTVPTTDLSGSIALASQVSGTLPIANGGTNNGSLVVTQGTVYYGDGTKLVGLAPGTSGQFLQTQGASANPQWASPSAAAAPYDVSGEFVGSPASAATIMRFVAARAFTFGGTAYFACTTNTGATTATFTVNVAGVSKGTVTIAGNATSGTGSITSTSVTAGQTITVVATTPANVVDVWFTLPGTV